MKRNMGSFWLLILVLAFVEYYSYVAFITIFKRKSKQFRKKASVLYIIGTLLLWLGMYWFRYQIDNPFPVNVKAIVITFFFGVFVAKIIAGLIMFIGDIINFIKYLTYKNKKPIPNAHPETNESVNKITRSVFLSRIALLSGGLMFGTMLYGVSNRYRYQIKRIKIKIDGLPVALKGMKIAQISDIHAGSFDNHQAVESGVKMLMAENPELIVFTGDLVNDKTIEIEPYIDIFSKLKAPLGVYSTLGNHDYGDYVTWPTEAAKVDNLEKLKQIQTAMGWKLMMNEHIIIERSGQEFALIGVENWSSNPRFPKHGRLDLAYAGLENKELPLKILLSHDPSHWDAEVTSNYKDINLTLSGHTHGMQFGVELPWFKWSPAQYVYQKWAGLYQEAKQYLYVNRGYGFLGYQGRVGILPEITIIEFE